MRSEFDGGVRWSVEGSGADGPFGAAGLILSGSLPASDERFQSAVMAGLMRAAVRQLGKAFRFELQRRPRHA